MDSSYLPPEILSHIFQHVPRRYLHRCLRVCKAWYHPAYKEFYRQITLAKNIRNNEIVKLLKESKFDNIFYGGQYVTKLVIKEIQPELLELLLPYLPELCNIEFKISEIFNKYEGALYKIENKRKTSPLLLQKLQSISFPLLEFSQRVNLCYFPICYQFRHTLTYLRLSYFGSNFIIDNQDNNYYNFLEDFTNLKQITANSLTPMITLLRILPDLQSFKIMSTYRAYEDVNDTLLDSLKQNKAFQGNKHLKHMDIRVDSLLSVYMKYIIMYIQHLETFYLCLTDTSTTGAGSFDKWITDNNFDIALQLATHLSLLRNVCIKGRMPSHLRNISYGGNMQDIAINNKEEMDRYWQFVQLLKGTDSNLFCEVYFQITDCFSSSRRSSFYWHIIKDKKNNKLNLRHHFNLAGLFDNNSMLQSVLLDQSSYSAIGFRHVHTLHVAIDSMAIADENEALLLSQLLTACPHLQQLCITRKSTNQVILVTSSQHDRKLKQTATNNVFDKVVITNAVIYPKLIDVLKRKVQQLKMLELRGCELPFDQNQNTTLDLRGILQLQYLDLQLYNLNLNNLIGGVFIQFLGIFAEEESVCYSWKKDQDDGSNTFWPAAIKDVEKCRNDEPNCYIPLITLEGSHYITNISFSDASHNTFNYKYSI